ncbi:peptidylprolyl isomerase [Massilia sp. CF038]|uniref:peptidylprolyl isomerase n=1 Tax=Massilia sp. CF038 TaxID=1881045 RepID=UPI0009159E28|nr:peptidylprolyl isomerase [Massilia sp. CF038]SHH22767.1 PPIC-type PPIASE domain-containing protein [Massilia sp. CF038]
MKWLAGVAACIAACTVQASQFHTLTLEVASRTATAERPLEQLAGDRAFAQWLRTRFSPATLHPPSRVGFEREAALDDQLSSALRGTYPTELEPVLRTLDRVVLESRAPDPMMLDRLFGKPGKLQLTYTLDSPQATLADAVKLITYALPGKPPASLSVADVLKRQNVQGRMAFFARDTSFMLQQARARVAGLLMVDWAQGRFGHDAVADLRQALADQDDVRAATGLYGLANDAEDVSPIQAGLAKRVTRSDIRAWYQANREQFRRIDRVRARHIRVPSEALANQIAKRAAQGEEFASLAQTYSVAPDAARGGALGWVRAGVDPSWLDALVLQQPDGKVSMPFRDPVGPDRAAHWEIILVDRRVESYQPAGSETVRYLARKAIALERARKEFAAARAQAALAFPSGGRP